MNISFKSWSWLDVAIFVFILAIDNLSSSVEGLWLTLLIAALGAASLIFTEVTYKYALLLNHPEQPCKEVDMLPNLIRSVLGVLLCIAPIYKGTFIEMLLGIGVAVVCLISVFFAYRLYSFALGDLKYEG